VTPAQFPNRLEFVNAEGASFVAGSGTGRGKSGKDGFTFGFVNFRGVEVFIQEHQKHSVPSLGYVDGAQTLTGFGVGEQTTSFYLQTAHSAAGLFNCVITRLPGRRQLDAKNSGGFVFCDLSGDAERLSGHGAIAPSEQLCIAKDFHRFSILAHGWACREL
jgi:hypothetical protein